jgi:putative addiction module component (TIGR02574 family)
MSNYELLEQALKLEPAEKLIVVEGLLNSLDEPDQKIDEIWADEAERRLAAYRAGKLKTFPMEEIFRSDT